MPHRFKMLCFDEEGHVRNGWKVLGFLLVLAALIVILNVTFRHVFHVKHVSDIENVALLMGLGFLASWICLRAERRPFAALGYRLDRRWGQEVLLGAALGAGIMVLTALLALGAGGFHWTRGTGTLGTTAWGFGMFVLVALNEETLFRGYLFQRLVGGIGPWFAQGLMAVLFALAHWGNPGMHGATRIWASLNIGLAAILLGLCYLRTHSLALPIGVHLGWNFTQGNLLGFGVSGTTMAPGLLKPVFQGHPEWVTGGAFGLEASLPCALVCTACILGLFLWKPRPATEPLPVPIA